ncbi:hypothetical protein BGZ73_001408 [Actinomortierella ambigua]|nr:hypothetical protein BGZ73_001408 [Actinomortierella ambigua]
MSTTTPPPVVAAASTSSSSTSKKPTFVPLTDGRSLLRPKKSTIDYNEPRLSSLANDALYAPPQVTSTHSTKTTATAANIPAVSGPSSLFNFDNHTPESAAYTAANVDQNKATDTTATASSSKTFKESEASTAGVNSSTSTAVDAHGGQYTILRIKRKRHEEPLDMLVVQELLGGSGSTRGKKAKTLDSQADDEVSNTLAGMQNISNSTTFSSTTAASSSSTSTATPAAIFRFAATVNEASFKDPAQSIQLRDQITRIQNNPSLSSQAPSPSPSASTTTARPRSRLGMDRPDRRSIIGGIGGSSSSSSSGGALTPTPSSQARGELAGKMQSEAKMARYRVVQKNRASLVTSEAGQRRAGDTTSSSSQASGMQKPPEVKSAVQVEAEAVLNMFNMLDAVKEELPKTKKQLEDEAIESDIMCNFLPMVKEYLSISEKTTDSSIVLDDKDKEGRAPLSRMDQLLAETGQDDDDDDEYVYDIYYRDMNADQTQASQYRAVGSLLWYEDDGEENFIHEEDSSGDDYEDSDSNAEDYYQNDYPEEEEDSDQYAYELSDTDDDDYMY